MFKKGTKMFSITRNKCPKCHEGDFFKYGFTYVPGKVSELHEHCPKCDFKYMIEPSFFYGAMYVGYAITVAMCVITFLLTVILVDISLLESFAVIFVVLVFMMPLNLRLSRILWINMFVSYDKKALKEATNKTS